VLLTAAAILPVAIGAARITPPRRLARRRH
jgi:hypothetical protein